jgi:hypothetical protein
MTLPPDAPPQFWFALGIGFTAVATALLFVAACALDGVFSFSLLKRGAKTETRGSTPPAPGETAALPGAGWGARPSPRMVAYYALCEEGVPSDIAARLVTDPRNTREGAN